MKSNPNWYWENYHLAGHEIHSCQSWNIGCWSLMPVLLPFHISQNYLAQRPNSREINIATPTVRCYWALSHNQGVKLFDMPLVCDIVHLHAFCHLCNEWIVRLKYDCVHTLQTTTLLEFLNDAIVLAIIKNTAFKLVVVVNGCMLIEIYYLVVLNSSRKQPYETVWKESLSHWWRRKWDSAEITSVLEKKLRDITVERGSKNI